MKVVLSVLMGIIATILSIAAAVIAVPRALVEKIFPLYLIILIIDFAVTYNPTRTFDFYFDFYIIALGFPILFLFSDRILMAISNKLLKSIEKLTNTNQTEEIITPENEVLSDEEAEEAIREYLIRRKLKK
jgi:hypothetical protein